jgi:trehalose 6-phosphate synthase/phosphatase
MKSPRLVVVSNRLPIVISQSETGQYLVSAGSGGLVTALAPVLRGRGGLWIGWPGSENVDKEQLSEALKDESSGIGFDLWPVPLSREEIHKFYYGFSNEILWPLFHDLPTLCKFDPATWPVYQDVNRKFAAAVAEATLSDDYVWVQDYHLLLVAQELVKLGARRKTGFFLHIPFPSIDLFLKLPWRFAVLEAMLQYDLIGFQTTRDRRNFLDCVRMLVSDVRVMGRGQVSVIQVAGREIRVGAFPISIDFQDYARSASSPDVAAEVKRIREQYPGQLLILGVDRLDYSKGIPERIRAVGRVLDTHPELQGKINFIQVVVPSRKEVPEYAALKRDIERLVGKINGRFTTSGWVPIHYIYRSLSRTELVAYYKACEIALITPLKDGMNLVCKEFCACSLENDSSLILSESAGAASQLHVGALIVNPHDIVGVADAIYRASQMGEVERKARMRKLRKNIRSNSVFHWVDSFLKAGFARELVDFPLVRTYPQVPRLPVGETAETPAES